MNKPTSENNKKTDRQVTGLAGELFVAAELLKRGMQTALTFGHNKAFDISAYNPETKRTFTVQVKSVRSKNDFGIEKEKVNENHTYVFVILNKPDEAVQYFVVTGSELANKKEELIKYQKYQSIAPAAFKAYENKWQVFDE